MKALAFAFGLAVFSIGLSTVIGYALGAARLYRWDEGIGMALNTGIAFIFTGSSICILASRAIRKYLP